jgi:hypothetical protein
MTTNNINEIRKDALAYRVKPSARVWEQLEQKLTHDSIEKKLIFYRLAAAALLAVCLTIGALYIKDTSLPQHTATNIPNHSEALLLEDLTTTMETGIYEADRLRILTSYYDKAGTGHKSLH